MLRNLKILPRISSLLAEAKRIPSHYFRAVIAEARGRPGARQGLASIARVAGLFRAKLRYGIGPLYYAYYHLADVPEADWPNYSTDEPAFHAKLRGMSTAKAIQLAQNKALMYEHCLRHDLATAPIICLVGRSPDPLSGLVQQVSTLAEWRSVLEDTHGDLFVKEVAGAFGDGAFSVYRRGGKFEFAGQSGSLDELFSYIKQNCKEKSGWIVQPRLQSHTDLQKYVSPHGLPTLRVITLMAGENPSLLYAVFKVTVRDNETDNFGIGTSGNLIAAVDCASGELACPWGSVSRKWPVMAPFPVHPDTKVTIEGKVLPCWDETVKLAQRAQASLPELKSSGWDIAICEQGPVLLEANVNYGMAITQIAHQRGLRPELYAVLDTVSYQGKLPVRQARLASLKRFHDDFEA